MRLSIGISRISSVASLLLFTAAIPAWGDETQTSIGEIPLCDLGPARFYGMMGGLYPGGATTRPADHEAVGIRIAGEQVIPRDASGSPAPDGKIVLISVGVSHTTMVFEVDGPNAFKPRADHDPSKNPRLVIVDGASSGHPTPQWLGHAPPWGGQDPWDILNQRLAAAHVTAPQVQVAWLMSIGGAYDDKDESFQAVAKNRQAGIEALVRALKKRFPNLALAYTTQRPYSYSDPVKGLAHEPTTYYSGFGDQWMLADQIEGKGDLNFDPARGKVVAPWLSWGPYQWADGIHPRSDGLAWRPSDFMTRAWDQLDWAHPSHAGVRKESSQLLAFFKTDPTSTHWFLRKADKPPAFDFTAEPTSGPAPLKVNFRATSPGAREIAWSFADGCCVLSDAPTKTFHVPGVYHVRATATDAAGNTATKEVAITVTGVCSPPPKADHYPPPAPVAPGKRPPSVHITSPSDGATITGPKQLVMTADVAPGDAKVSRVDFFKGGSQSQDGPWSVWLGQAAEPPYRVTWDYDPSLEYDPAGGRFIVTAKATDADGNVSESSVRITVSAKP